MLEKENGKREGEEKEEQKKICMGKKVGFKTLT